MPPPILMRSPEGEDVEVPEDQVAYHARQGFTAVTPEERAAHVADAAREERFTSPAAKVTTGILSAGRLVTGGMSDVLADQWGLSEDVNALREANPITDVAGTVLGAATGVGAAGLASRAGSAVSRTAEGASALAKVGRAAAGAAVEGGALGIQAGVSEVALSAKPLDLENVVSTISSNALFGGAVGGAAGGLLKAGGVALRGAQSKLDDIAAHGAGEIDDAAKVALRDEVAAFRKQLKTDQPWIAAKESGVDGLTTVGKRSFKADKALDNLLDDPKALVDNPKAALRHLRMQESALAEVAAKSDEVRAALTKQSSVRRMAALDKVAPTLEANRALQAKIESMIAKPAATGGGGLAGNMLGGQAFGLGASIAGAIPVVGPLLAPIAGAAASKLVTEGLGKMAAKQAARTSKAIGAVLDVTGKMPNVAPVLASKVLSSVRFSEGKAPKQPETKKGSPAPKIADAYKRVTDDIKQQTQIGPDGKAMMRPAARERMASTFDAVRMVDPIAADKLETTAARRVTALSDRLPRKPDVFGHQSGPSTWQPSDMEMRAYARFVAAVEDPIGVIERLATGQVTTEDRDAMKTVYPEMYADVQAQIMAQLPTLQKQLPYHRRLALSIFSEIPVDPALDPVVLSVLQAQYVEEPETEGGTQAPIAKPQFGSVKAEQPTAAQSREQGATT